MSKAEIIEELPLLSLEERREVQARLDELEEGEWLDGGELTGAEKAAIAARLEECERNPGAFIPWAEAEARLKARFSERAFGSTSCPQRRTTSAKPPSGMRRASQV